uniref:C2H2-type domain-containing protein n=1 Tax=Neospora caninum (strain Liverpool) TaxID=572307 RepID=A0A0F7UJQ3_NEOCL|nr:TPA: hypothetical protein BN1204_045340 [Neospora caninum Liverpool]
MTQADLLAAAVDELALEGEQGATFPELLLLLSAAHPEFPTHSREFQAALWRALYNSPLVFFSHLQAHAEDADDPPTWTAAEGTGEDARRLNWRHPRVPPLLPSLCSFKGSAGKARQAADTPTNCAPPSSCAPSASCSVPERRAFPRERCDAASSEDTCGKNPKQKKGDVEDARHRPGGLAERGGEGTECSEAALENPETRKKKGRGKEGREAESAASTQTSRPGRKAEQKSGSKKRTAKATKETPPEEPDSAEERDENDESREGPRQKEPLPDACLAEWRFSVSAAVRLNALGVPFSPFLDEEEIEKKMKEMPMVVLQAITKRRYAGHWQYQLSIDLGLPPKTVFHHLKPLYRQGLVTHMQLPLPASSRPSAASRGSSNLTMSALLWHFRFFDFPRLPSQIQATVSLHHLVPLEHQVVEMLQGAPMHVMLESEIHAFCLEAFTTSERFALASFTAKQFRRLYQKLRGELMRSGRVQRLRAWCPQTQKFEKCLCLSSSPSHSASVKANEEEGGDEGRGTEGNRQGLQQGEAEGRSRQREQPTSLASSAAWSRVKQEPGTNLLSLTPSAASAPAGRGKGERAPPETGDAAEMGEGEGDEPRGGDDDEADGEEAVCSLLAWELPLADQVVMLLEASGGAGLLSIQVARYIGTDNKRAGKIFAELERRKRVRKVAERRGRCFMYRYFASSVPDPAVPAPSGTPLPAPRSASAFPGNAQGRQPVQREETAHAPQRLPGQQGTEDDTSRDGDRPSASAPCATLAARQQAPDGAADHTGDAPANPEGDTDVRGRTGKGRGGGRARHGRGTVLGSQGGPDSQGTQATGVNSVSSSAPSPVASSRASSGSPGGRGRRGRRDGQADADRFRGEAAAPAALETQAALCPHSGTGSEGGASLDTRENSRLSPSVASPSSSASPIIAADALSPAKLPLPGSSKAPDRSGARGSKAAGALEATTPAAPSVAPGTVPQTSLSLPGSPREREEIDLSLALEKNQIRKLNTPQFERRLRLFIAHLRSEGCATIPTIAKVLAKAESSVNGPDRKTVQRMAAVAMQVEPRVAVGGLVKPDGERAREKKEEVLRPDGDEEGDDRFKGVAQRRVGTEVVFYYWTEKFTEEQAHRRVTEMISARRIEGCRLAVHRNERLLSGLRDQQRAGDTRRQEHAEQRKALEDEIVKLQRIEEKSKMMVAGGADGDGRRGAGGGMPLTMQPEQVHVSPVLHVVAKQRLGADANALHAAGVLHFSQKTLALYGFLFPVMVRLKCLHQYLLQLLANLKKQVECDSPPTASSLAPSSSLRPPPRDLLDNGMTLAYMLRKMPLEIFLRTIGCGYRVPFLDKQLSAPHASQLLLEGLPRTVFDILVLSSRQLHLKRQRQQPPTLPLTGNNKRSAPAALRRLLSTLYRMGLVRVSGPFPSSSSPSSTVCETRRDDQATAGSAEGSAGDTKRDAGAGEMLSGVARWHVVELVSLPAFVSEKEPRSSADGSAEAPSLGRFALLVPGAFEAFWGDLQSEVARWIHFNAPLPPASFDAFPGRTRAARGEREAQSLGETHESRRHSEAKGDNEETKGLAELSRPKVPLPANFPVAEAFSKRNWKGQILLTPYLRAELDAFAENILERYREAGGEELGRLVFSPHSPEVQDLAARLRIPTDVVLRFLLRLFETRGGIGCGFQSLALHLPGPLSPGGSAGEDEDAEARGGRRKRRRLEDDDVAGSVSGGGESETDEDSERREKERRADDERRKERERKLLVGRRLLLLHRTRDVRFRCHLCGCLYSLIRALKHHYQKIHKTELPADSDAYVLPWEKEKRIQKVQQAQEQRQLALAFRRKRKQQERGDELDNHAKEEDDEEEIPSFPHFRDEDGSLDNTTASWFPDRPGKGSHGASSSAAGLLSAAVQRFLRSMRKEDEFVFVAASVVAERLFVAAQRLAFSRQSRPSEPAGGEFDAGRPSSSSSSFPFFASNSSGYSTFSPGCAGGSENVSDPTSVFGVDGRTVPAAAHPVWQIISTLCSATLEPTACMHIFSFLMLHRPTNYRAFNNCRRLAGFDLKSRVNACRIPSLLDTRPASLEDACEAEADPFALADAALFAQPHQPHLPASSLPSDRLVGAGEPADRLLLRPAPSPSWGLSLTPQRMRAASLTCRPLNCPRVVLARTVLKMILLTPLTHYRPYTAFEAAQELREGEWTAVWRVWSLRGWVTHVKQPLPLHLRPPRARSSAASTSAGSTRSRSSAVGRLDEEEGRDDKAGEKGEKREGGATRKSPLHALLAAKCRRSFALSAGARAALFGKLRVLRSLSACCHAILENSETCNRDSEDTSCSAFQAASPAAIACGPSLASPRCTSPGVSARSKRGGCAETEETADQTDETANEPRQLRRQGTEGDPETQGICALSPPDGEKKDVASAGISWRDISNASLGISPASALILLERMAQDDLLLLPGWEADRDGLSPLQACMQGNPGGGAETEADTRDGQDDPVEQYYARVCGPSGPQPSCRRTAGYEGQKGQSAEGESDTLLFGDSRGSADAPTSANEERASRSNDGKAEHEQEPLGDEAADEAAEAEELLDDEDLDRSLLRLLLEGTGGASGAPLPSDADAASPSADNSGLFASSFLAGDGDDEDDDKARDEDHEHGDRAASLAARIVEGGVTTHLLRLTRGVPHLASLRMQTRDSHAVKPSRSFGVDTPVASPSGLVVRRRASASTDAGSCEGEGAKERRELERAASNEAQDATGAVKRGTCEVASVLPVSLSCARRPAAQRDSPLPPPGYHLVDGFLGAASEQDAVDPSMFPPTFSHGSAAFAAWAHHVLAASSEGTCLGDNSRACEGGKEENAWNLSPPPLPEAGSGGFPLCLPEFEEDRKWGWWRDATATVRLHASPVYSPLLFKAQRGSAEQSPDDAPAEVNGRKDNAPNSQLDREASRLSPRGTAATAGSACPKRRGQGNLEGATDDRGGRAENRKQGGDVGREAAGRQGFSVMGERCAHQRRGQGTGPDEEQSGKGTARETGKTDLGSAGGARLTFIHESSFPPSGGPILDREVWRACLLASESAEGARGVERREECCRRKGKQAPRPPSPWAADSNADTEADRSEAGGNTQHDACTKCGARALHALAVGLLTRQALLPILPNPLPSYGSQVLLEALEWGARRNEDTQDGKGEGGDERRADWRRGKTCKDAVSVGDGRNPEGAISKHARGTRKGKASAVSEETGDGPASLPANPVPVPASSSACSQCCCCCLYSPSPSPHSLAVLFPLLKLAAFVLSCTVSAKADGLPACAAFHLFLGDPNRQEYLQGHASLQSDDCPLQDGPSSSSNSSSSPSIPFRPVCGDVAGGAADSRGDSAVAELVASLRTAARELAEGRDKQAKDGSGQKENWGSAGQDERNAESAVREGKTQHEDEWETGSEDDTDKKDDEEELLGAAVGQAFLLVVSLLQALRFLVVVPGAHDWHLVDAQEASRRYCVRRLAVVEDHIGKLKHEDGSCGGDVVHRAKATQPREDSGHVQQTTPRSHASLSPSSPPPERPASRGEGSTTSSLRQRPFLPARETLDSCYSRSGVSPVIRDVWGETSGDRIETRRRLNGEEGKTLFRVSCVTQVAQSFFARAFFEERHRERQRQGDQMRRRHGSIAPATVDGVASKNTERGKFGDGLFSSFAPHGILSRQDRGDSLSSVSRCRASGANSPERARRQREGTPDKTGETGVCGEETENKEHADRSGKLAVLQSDVVSVAPWLRLDGRVHASLLQVLALRCWTLLTGKPGSSATEVKDALAVLDLADVAFLLQSWTRDGLLRCASLLPSPGSSPPSSLPLLASSSAVLSGDSSPGRISSVFPDSCTPVEWLSTADQRRKRRLGVSVASLGIRASPECTQTERERKKRRRGGEETGEGEGTEWLQRGDASESTADGHGDSKTGGMAIHSTKTREERLVDRRGKTTARRHLEPLPVSAIRRVTEQAQALALHAKTLYFPERAEDVLPEFRDLLLPRAL